MARASGDRLLLLTGAMFTISGLLAILWLLWGLGPSLSWAVFCSAFCFVALCGACCKSGRRRILFLVLCTITGFYLLLHSLGAVAVVWMIRQGERPGPRAMAMQTTPFSCLPAAAATCLWKMGRPAREAALAEASGTTLNGTSMWRMARVLDGRLGNSPWKARYGTRTWEALPGDGVPAILDVLSFNHIPHAVAFLGFEGNFAKIGDPLDGEIRRMKRGELEQSWSGKGIWFERKDEGR